MTNTSVNFDINADPDRKNQYNNNKDSIKSNEIQPSHLTFSTDSKHHAQFAEIHQINNNPQYANEYSTEIMIHWKVTESLNIANYSSLFIHQKEINERSRAILIEWLTDVHLKYKLFPETLYLTINIIDRYLEKKYIEPSSFQLLGICSMLIGSKYEEIYSPEIRDFIHLSRGTYTREQIIKMESQILSILNFDLIYTSSYSFLLRYYYLSDDNNIQVFHLAQYIIELSFINLKIMNYPQSIRACAALYMARKVLCFDNPWLDSLKIYTGYDENNLKSCIKMTVLFLKSILKHKSLSFIEKFKSHNYSEVALIFLSKVPQCSLKESDEVMNVK